MSDAIERRFLPAAECDVKLETRADGESPKIVGRAAVFYDESDPDTEYQLFPDLKERIMPNAFNRALNDKHDVRALVNHDPNLLLGRTTAGTLKLSKSLRGLDYAIDPPDTQAGRDVQTSIKRGDMTGSSFGFRVLKQRFITEKTADGMPIDVRLIDSVELLDVSPVTYPAYKSTTTGLRSEGDAVEARSAHTAWKAQEAAEEQRKASVAAKLAEYKARAAEVGG